VPWLKSLNIQSKNDEKDNSYIIKIYGNILNLYPTSYKIYSVDVNTTMLDRTKERHAKVKILSTKDSKIDLVNCRHVIFETFYVVKH